MSDKEVAEHVLDVLRGSQEPVRPKQLFERLHQWAITDTQGRRALVNLADQRKIEITSDRKVAFSGRR